MEELKLLQKNGVDYTSKNKKKVSKKKVMKLIEVRFGHEEYSQDDCYGSWTEYDNIAFFDNIEDAWNFVQARVVKFHTNLKDYSFNIIEINPSPETIPSNYYEQAKLDHFHKEIEREKQRKIDEKTLGFRCSECKKILKMGFYVDSEKTNHARKHMKNSSWSHVDWKRIMKKTK